MSMNIDADRPEGEPPALTVTRGRLIWITHPQRLGLVRRMCLLPNAWGAFVTLARQSVTAVPPAVESAVLPLSEVERAWDRLLSLDEPQSSGPPRSGAQNLEEQLARLDDGSKLLHLYAALKIVQQLWNNEPEPSDLSLALVLPETPGGEVEYTANDALLAFEPGSLSTYVAWKAVFTGSKWVLALALTRGRVSSQIAKDIVEGLRAARIARGGHALSRVREATKQGLRDKRGVIVFLHGLLSTDVGLFDAFITQLQSDPVLRDRYLLLGFPHDTFAAIETNAHELMEDLLNLLGDTVDTPLAFVCHSRGGLLARRVAADLYAASPSRWRRQVACCVTFGTPHQGSPLAEHWPKLLAAAVTGMRLLQPAGFMGARDVLALVRAYNGELPGVENLMPIGAKRKNTQYPHFLETLRKEEHRLAGTDHCQLPILAIGGEAPPDARLDWITSRLFHDERNDFAVALESAAPRMHGVATEEVASNHFGYFSGGHGFASAISFLKEKTGYDGAVPSMASASAVTVSRPRRVRHSAQRRR